MSFGEAARRTKGADRRARVREAVQEGVLDDVDEEWERQQIQTGASAIQRAPPANTARAASKGMPAAVSGTLPREKRALCTLYDFFSLFYMVNLSRLNHF